MYGAERRGETNNEDLYENGIALWDRQETWRTADLVRSTTSHGMANGGTAIMREEYSLTFPPLSITKLSFRELSGLMCRGENENAQTTKLYQRNDPNPSSLDCKYGILPKIE